ncbi:YheC/YheD family protein [Patescibacteria group bacterium]
MAEVKQQTELLKSTDIESTRKFLRTRCSDLGLFPEDKKLGHIAEQFGTYISNFEDPEILTAFLQHDHVQNGIDGALHREFNPDWDKEHGLGGSVEYVNVLDFPKDVDPKKVAQAITSAKFVHEVGVKEGFETQNMGAINSVAFVNLEFIQDNNIDISKRELAIRQLEKKHENETHSQKKSLIRNIIATLSNNPEVDNEKAFVQQLAKDVNSRIHRWNEEYRKFNQTQGIEIEVIKRKTKSEPARRRGVDVDKWLPRGSRKSWFSRKDWHILPFLDLAEDPGERPFQIFEVAPDPTESITAQNTVIQALMAGDFVDESKLSWEQEGYSLHSSTVFKKDIWTDEAEIQYHGLSRVLSGAFASDQRIQYGGFAAGRLRRKVVNADGETIRIIDTSGEVKQKETGSKSIKKKKLGEEIELVQEEADAPTSNNYLLVEIRSLDVNPTGQFSALHQKQALDSAFRNHWEIETGVNQNPTTLQMQMSQRWETFNAERIKLFKKHGIDEEPLNGWLQLARAMEKNSTLRSELVGLSRKHGRVIRRNLRAHHETLEGKNSEQKPTVGILTSANLISKEGRLIAGTKRENQIKKLIRASQEHGVQAVVLHPSTIDAKDGFAVAYTLDDQDDWVPVLSDVPNIVLSYSKMTPTKQEVVSQLNSNRHEVSLVSSQELSSYLQKIQEKKPGQMNKAKTIKPEGLARNDNRIFIPKSELSKYPGVKIGDEISIQFGTGTTKVRVAAAKTSRINSKEKAQAESESLRLSPNLATELPTTNVETVFSPESKTLTVGPLVGIMSRITTSGSGKPQIAQTAHFKRITKAAQEKGASVVVFSPESVDAESNSISGWRYNTENRIWEEFNTPVPTVVYDRSFVRRGRELDQAKLVRSSFENRPDVTLVNSEEGALSLKDKKVFAETLSANSALERHHPKTAEFTQSEPDFIEDFEEFYIKPSDGSQGKGIIFVRRTKGGYAYSNKEKGKDPIEGKAKTYEEIFEKTSSIRKSKSYIIQAGIVPTKHNDRLFDIRTCVQQNGRGQTEFIGMAARVGGENSKTSNISTGGEVAAIDTVLKKFGPKAALIKKQIESLSLIAAREIELQHGPIRDLSIDFVVSEDGTPYIIEGNDKAGQLFGDLNDHKTNNKRTRVLVENALSISHQTSESTITAEVSQETVKARLLPETFGRKDDRLYIPENKRRELGVLVGDEIVVSFGHKDFTLKVAESKKQRDDEEFSWRVSPNVFDQVHTPSYMRPLSKWDKDSKRLSLGPVVGILARQDQFGDGVSGEPFGDSTEEIYDNIRYSSKNGGVLYAFSPTTIDWTAHTVKAYFPQNLGEDNWKKVAWKEVEIPLPEIYWNRHFSKTTDQRRSSKAAKRRLRVDLGIEPANPINLGATIGSKNRFQEFLKEHPELSRFSPESNKLQSPTTIEQMLSRHDSVYVKPAFGTKGRGIVKAWKKDDTYHFSYTKGDDVVEGTAKSARELIEKSGIKTKKTYIVQQGLELARVDGKIFDVRILPQKADGKNWTITGMAARVAADEKSITSNLHTGGKAEKVRPVLEGIFPKDEARRIIRDLEKAASSLGKALDRHVKKPILEIGVDVGIDVNGNVWIIEANPMPGRGVFLDTEEKEKRRAACSNPMSNFIARTDY